MQLNHSFTVPAPLSTTWAAFEDIDSVAGCFPGATVTSVDGDDFTGTCKVKLGPIALTYAGSGSFVAKDREAGTFRIEAKGKDKRGNGTAGATVTATLTEAAPAVTDVAVVTDLSITGKPAQFGRGVMQDVSDKLLQQFVTCLQDRVGTGEAVASHEVTPETVAPHRPAPQATAAPTTAQQGVGPVAAAETSPAGTAGPDPTESEISPVRSPAPGTGASDDALDLGSTVLPVLARTYGPRLGAGLLVLLLGYVVLRRRRLAR